MSRAQIINADAIAGLSDLEAESVQTCITSPPYWGLRDYGTATWEGGDPDCDHKGKPMATRANVNANTGGRDVKNAEIREFYKERCGKCGAKRIDDQLGLESTPEEYVKNMVAVFREVRRVLRDDGTLWLNLGDSYAGSWGAQSRPNGNDAKSNLDGGSMLSARQIEAHPKGQSHTGSLKNTPGLKGKDLVGIPWRVAFALQDDGWYLRSDIIWHKPNPMPESVTDRPTKAHEYLFLLTKSPRYYYDADAIRETGTIPAGTKAAKGSAERAAQLGVNGRPPEYKVYDGQRNKRTVWTVTTKPFSGAHFAVFPPDLIEPCVLAGSAEGDTVLDPFTGSGTTGMVALRHGRDFVGTELNPEYAAMAEKRITDDAPLLNEVAA